MSVTITWRGPHGVVRVQPRLVTAGLDFGFGEPLAMEVGAKVSALLWINIREVYEPRLGPVEVLRAVRDLVRTYEIERVWADPENPQMIAYLQTHGLPVIANQIRDVDFGLRTVYGLLKRQVAHPLLGPGPGFRVDRTSCPNLIEEFGRYGYPQVKGEIRSKTPIDRHNHALDTVRYYLTGEGEIPPEDLHTPAEDRPTMFRGTDGQWRDDVAARFARTPQIEDPDEFEHESLLTIDE